MYTFKSTFSSSARVFSSPPTDFRVEAEGALEIFPGAITILLLKPFAAAELAEDAVSRDYVSTRKWERYIYNKM